VKTLNFLGCYYRRVKNFDKALLHLQKATCLIEQNNLRQDKGITFLNVGAVLSECGKKKEAFEYS